MDKKTIDTLRVMLCGEIDEIAKQGKFSHESLDVLKDLVETEKNLAKIEKYDEEKKEKEEMKQNGGMSMEGGYSQRKYYIDADYQPGMMSYARGGGSYMDGNYARAGGGGGGGGSSRMGGNYGMYDMGGSYADGGNSYGMFYDPRYDMYARAGGGSSRAMGGYARAGGKEEMVQELQKMMGEATDENVKRAIQEAITKVNK